MTKPFRQPVKKRIQDITLYGVLFLVMSILSGTFKILLFTIPAFLILAAILATGRYRNGRVRHKTLIGLEQERKKRIYSGCGSLAARKHILGY